MVVPVPEVDVYVLLICEVLDNGARSYFKLDCRSMSGIPGVCMYSVAAEKYFGINKARSGRIAGKQAQTIPVLTSRTESVACAELSNEISLLFATSLRVYRRTIEISGALVSC
jgi:hypothetical protein